MKPSTEPMAEVLSGLLNSLDNVGTKKPTHNVQSHTGALGALIMRLKAKLVQLFI